MGVSPPVFVEMHLFISDHLHKIQTLAPAIMGTHQNKTSNSMKIKSSLLLHEFPPIFFN